MPSETLGAILFAQKNSKFAGLCCCSLQPFSYDYDLASDATNAMGIKSIYEWRAITV